MYNYTYQKQSKLWKISKSSTNHKIITQTLFWMIILQSTSSILIIKKKKFPLLHPKSVKICWSQSWSLKELEAHTNTGWLRWRPQDMVLLLFVRNQKPTHMRITYIKIQQESNHAFYERKLHNSLLISFVLSFSKVEITIWDMIGTFQPPYLTREWFYFFLLAAHLHIKYFDKPHFFCCENNINM